MRAFFLANNSHSIITAPDLPARAEGPDTTDCDTAESGGPKFLVQHTD